MQNASLDDLQARIKIFRWIIYNLRYVDDKVLMADSEKELKSLWWGWRRRVKKPF